jgi:hypothetical protein
MTPLGRIEAAITRRRRFGRHTAIAAVAVPLTLTLFAGLAYATIPSRDTGRYTACVRTDGSLRMIDYEAGARCARGERSISWSKGWQYRGAWRSTTAYATGDATVRAGSTYLAKSPNSNVAPGTDTAVWGLLATAGARGPRGPAGKAGTNATQLSVYDGETRLGPLTAAFAEEVWYLSAAGVVTQAKGAEQDGVIAFSGPNCTGTPFYFVQTGLRSIRTTVDTGLGKFVVTGASSSYHEEPSHAIGGFCGTNLSGQMQTAEAYVDTISIR